MSLQTFDHSVKFILEVEGGVSDDASDKGGYTKFGIASASHGDVSNLTIDGAIKIYREQYWDAVNGDILPYPLDVLAFDSAVNCGPGRAIKWLQQAYNETHPDAKQLSVDGDYGPCSVVTISNGNIERVFYRLLAFRIDHYTNLCRGDSSQRRFQDGWMFRLSKLLRHVSKDIRIF